MAAREDSVPVYRQGVGVVLDDTARPLVLLTGEVVTVGGWPPAVEVSLDLGDPEVAPLSFHEGTPAVVHGCVQLPAKIAEVRGCARFLGERVAILVLPLQKGPDSMRVVARDPLPAEVEVSRLRALLGRAVRLLGGARALADDTMRPDLDAYLGDAQAALSLAPAAVPTLEQIAFLLAQVLDHASGQDLEGIVWTAGRWSEDERIAATIWAAHVFGLPKGAAFEVVAPPHVEALRTDLREHRESVGRAPDGEG